MLFSFAFKKTGYRGQAAIPAQGKAVRQRGLGPAPRFDAADFSKLLGRRTVTEEAYEGVPLAELATATRANVLTSVVREIDTSLHPDARIEDAVPGTRIDDSKRGQHQAPYDWQRDGVRVACKSAQLKWNTSNRRWMVLFANIKPSGAEGEFDELLLALYTPRGVHVYRHDLRLGMSTNGKATEATGRTIFVYGPCDEESWQSALDGAILPKLDERGCERVAEVPW